MKAPRSYLQIAPALLALALLVVPLTSFAADAPADRKLTKAKEKFDADKDGKLNDEEMAAAKEAAREKAKQTRAEHRKMALEKYDANGDGKLDKEERAKMKSDEEAAVAERKAKRAERKAEREAKRAAKEGDAK